MFCKNCGANVKDGTKFCTSCGSPMGSSEATQTNSKAVKKIPMNGILSKVLIALCAIFVVGFLAIKVLKVHTMFLSTSDKILLAGYNTIMDVPEPLKGLIKSSIWKSDFTVTSEDGFEFKNGKKDKELKMSYYGKDIIAQYSKNKLKIQYDEDNIYVIDDIEDDINDLISKALGRGGDLSILTPLIGGGVGDIRSDFKGIDIEKIESTEVNINGKDKKCKGYSLKAPKSFLQALYGALGGGSLSSDLNSGLNMKVYLYGDKIAKVSWKYYDDSYSIAFNGGDFRMQTWTFKADDETIKVKKKVDEDTKNIVLYHKDDYGTDEYIEYNSKTGYMKLQGAFEGYIKNSGSKIEIRDDDNEVVCSIKKGIKLSKLKGEEEEISFSKLKSMIWWLY